MLGAVPFSLLSPLLLVFFTSLVVAAVEMLEPASEGGAVLLLDEVAEVGVVAAAISDMIAMTS